MKKFQRVDYSLKCLTLRNVLVNIQAVFITFVRKRNLNRR